MNKPKITFLQKIMQEDRSQPGATPNPPVVGERPTALKPEAVDMTGDYRDLAEVRICANKNLMLAGQKIDSFTDPSFDPLTGLNLIYGNYCFAFQDNGRITVYLASEDVRKILNPIDDLAKIDQHIKGRINLKFPGLPPNTISSYNIARNLDLLLNRVIQSQVHQTFSAKESN